MHTFFHIFSLVVYYNIFFCKKNYSYKYVFIAWKWIRTSLFTLHATHFIIYTIREFISSLFCWYVCPMNTNCVHHTIDKYTVKYKYLRDNFFILVFAAKQMLAYTIKVVAQKCICFFFFFVYFCRYLCSAHVMQCIGPHSGTHIEKMYSFFFQQVHI